LSQQRPIRALYFGTYRAGYSRNQIMMEGLRRNGVQVIECNQQLWRGIEDRVQVASGGWASPSFLLRVAQTYLRLLGAYRRAGDYDVMVLGYPGQHDVFMARLLTWARRRPLLLDQFMSVYLVAWERGLTQRHPVSGKILYWLERAACHLPDALIQDTRQYVQWSRDTFGLDPGRIQLVPTGADDRLFRPVDERFADDGVFRVLYYGTFIPNHGVTHVIEAARVLRDEPEVHFELAGDGPERAEAEALARRHGLENVTFLGWVDKRELPRKIARANLCLGAFGTTPQSLMTVQNKIYECLAQRKCVVTGESEPVAEALTHGRHVWLCERASGEALAQAIRTLKQDPGLVASLAEQGHACFAERFTPEVLGKPLVARLQAMVLGAAAPGHGSEPRPPHADGPESSPEGLSP
jgi:glycosyltransferase involved in cell wall biosynthesis